MNPNLTLTKFTEAVQSALHILHVTKPLLFELLLFVWAVAEMVKFAWEVIVQ